MWRDDAQACRALRVLLLAGRMEDLFTEQGPTARMTDLVAADGGPLSTAERVLLLAAWDLWTGGNDPLNPKGPLHFHRVLDLHGPPRQALCSLVMAIDFGGTAIDAWIGMMERGELERGHRGRL